MKFVNNHRDVLLNGRTLSHDGFIYKADLTQRKVYRESVSDYLSKAETWTQIGLIAPDGSMRRIGNKFKSLREYAGVAVADVAKGTGIPLNTLLNYDQGQRHIALATAQTVFHIARYFGVTMEELISEDLLEIEKK